MKKQKILMRAIVLALLVSAMLTSASLAKVDVIKFKVSNYTNKDVTVFLYGDEDYEIVVQRGSSETIEIDEGEYDYEYFACGTTVDDSLDLEKNFTLIIYACDTVPTKMRINSHFADDLVVELSGPEDYDFDVSLGKNVVDLFSGLYVYSYEACDGRVFSGEVRVLKNGTTDLTLHGCEWWDSPARLFAKPVPIKVRIINHGNFPVDVTLVGPGSYTLTVLPGINVYSIIYGNYTWYYYLDYQYTAGFFKAEKNGASSFIITPNRIFAPPDATDTGLE